MKTPILIISTLLATAISTFAETRQFTSTKGAKIEATLISVNGDKVTIKRTDGKDFTTAAINFSAKDQEYIKTWKPEGSTAANTDWYQWRGPNRDNISTETGLNHDWDKKEPQLAWRTKGLGGGMSSIAISDGKIFTLGESDGTNLHCLSLEDGSELWSTKIPGGGGPNGTPTVDPDSGLVFGLSKDGELSAVNIADGSIAWSVSYTKDLGGKMMSGWGYSESPLIDGDRLICTPGGKDALIAALDKKTGKEIWKTDASDADLGEAGKDGAGYSSIVISNAAGVKQYVQLVGRGLVGVSADDGKLLWNYNRIANGTANVPTPIIKDDYVFGSTGYDDGGSALLKLRKKGSGIEAKEEYYYEAKKLQNHHGGMILVGDHIFMGNGHNNGFPQCVELTSGKILWDKERGEGAESAAITYADGHLFFRYQNHVMALIEANPKKYTPKGSFKIASSNDNSWPQPVIQNKKLYLRDQDELLCYDISE
jgi:outer membrane protein assembly factor BamB